MLSEETSVKELCEHFEFDEDETSQTLMLNELVKITLEKDESDSYKLAAKVSVAKWIVLYKFLIEKGIVKVIHSNGADTCGMCIKSNYTCGSCPIKLHTGYTGCNNTPHYVAACYLGLRNDSFENGLKSVKDELEFVIMIANKIEALSAEDLQFIDSVLQ
jgi:hypothetical protein